jgi:hypothetical protein
VSCLRNSLTKSSDAGENLISGFGPDKRRRIVVSEFDIVFDGLFQFERAAMSRSFDLFSVSKPNHRSTRLSHEALVGVKCK